tara:strand:+ start:8 stop:943 length:936 start_codon:yes stop_codon:yes gene_type:complete
MRKIDFKFIEFCKKQKGSIDGGLRKKSKIKNPLFSIITVNLNDDLESTILSIKFQKYRNLIEHIIIDGGSRKNYLKLLKYYNKDIDYWVSEKDNGIWDASNKGVTLAKGKFIGLLDSGDILSQNASEILKKMFKLKPNADCVIGSVMRSRLLSGFYPHKISTHLNVIPSNSGGFFLNKNMQKKLGLFDERYKCSADYDLVYKMIKSKKVKFICSKKHEILSKKIPEGFSTKYGFFNNLLEEVKIRNSNGENFIYTSFLAIAKTINKLLSIIRSFDGNKFVKYKYLEIEKNQINNLNKFYEYIQKKKKFKKI